MLRFSMFDVEIELAINLENMATYCEKEIERYPGQAPALTEDSASVWCPHQTMSIIPNKLIRKSWYSYDLTIYEYELENNSHFIYSTYYQFLIIKDLIH